jgi:G3E family GTPase
MVVLQTEVVIRRLNPGARLLRCERCRVGVSEVLGSGRYDMTAAAAHADWQQVSERCVGTTRFSGNLKCDRATSNMQLSDADNGSTCV